MVIVTFLVALDKRQRNLKTCAERVAAIVPIGIGCVCVANIASGLESSSSISARIIRNRSGDSCFEKLECDALRVFGWIG